MFRNFYFLVLLISFKVCFCYHHTAQNNEVPSKLHYNKNRRRITRTSPHQEYDEREEDSQVAQINLASFVQNDNVLRQAEGYRSHKKTKKSSSKSKHDSNDKHKPHLDKNLNYKMPYEDNHYEGLESSNFDQKNKANSPLSKYDSLSLDDDSNFRKNLHNRELSSDSIKLSDKNSQHSKRKCGSKKLKFPFFSHKSDQANIDAKKKPAGLNTKNNKKTKDAYTHYLDQEAMMVDTRARRQEIYPVEKVKKRSYIENLCPVCRKKFLGQEQRRRKRKSSQILHNSRQYYLDMAKKSAQDLQNQVLYKQREDFRGYIDPDVKENNESETKRRRRDEETHMHISDRDRQLKELEEVQRKIDSVQIKGETKSFNLN